MNGTRQRAFLWLTLAIALAVAAFVEFKGSGAGAPLQSNLLTLLPPTERNAVAEQAVNRLADSAGNRAFFLIGAPSAKRKASSTSGAENAGNELAGRAAREFAAQLRASGAFRSVIAEVPPFDPQLLARFYRPHRFGLLADADRAALARLAATGAAERLDWLGERLQRRLYAPFQFGPGYPLEDDPFALADGWLAALPLKTLRVETHDALLVARDGEALWFIVSAELPGSAYDSAVQKSVVAAVAQAEAQVEALRTAADEAPHLTLLRAGTVFYAAQARQSAEREVDLIGLGSLLGMLALLYLVFRSLRPLALGLLSVGFGVVAAATVTVAVYGQLHLITLVFGASLIGEAIDYAVQYFAAHLGAGADWDAVSGLRRIAPGLLLALATSLLGYGALLLAPFPALAQIALFALVGLSAACATVFLLLPWLLRAPGKRDPASAVAPFARLLDGWRRHVGRRACLVLAALLLAVAAPGWTRLTSNDDVRILIARPEQLVAQEEKIRALTGFGNVSQFFLVEGATPDQVLRHEEALRERLATIVGDAAPPAVSAFVPSLERQQQNRALWQQGVFADRDALARQLSDAGLRDDISATLIDEFTETAPSAAGARRPLTIDDWLASPLSAPYRHLWLGAVAGGYASVVQPPAGADAEQLAQLAAATKDLPGISYVDKAGSVSRLFADYRQWGALWLTGAMALVYGVLVVRYGLIQAATMLLPTLLAIALTLAAFGYLGTPLTLFNVMGLMLVIGVGVNYAIFLREGSVRGVAGAATLAGVLLSAGTTLLSFGLLAFSSLPALAGFGLTLLFGICGCVLLAPMVLSFGGEAER